MPPLNSCFQLSSAPSAPHLSLPFSSQHSNSRHVVTSRFRRGRRSGVGSLATAAACLDTFAPAEPQPGFTRVTSFTLGVTPKSVSVPALCPSGRSSQAALRLAAKRASLRKSFPCQHETPACQMPALYHNQATQALPRSPPATTSRVINPSTCSSTASDDALPMSSTGAATLPAASRLHPCAIAMSLPVLAAGPTCACRAVSPAIYADNDWCARYRLPCHLVNRLLPLSRLQGLPCPAIRHRPPRSAHTHETRYFLRPAVTSL